MNNKLSSAVLCLSLAACGGGAEVDPRAMARAGAPRVIVADIDSTINPYHEYYYAGSPIYKDKAPSAVTPEVLAELNVRPENQVTLTRTGNMVKDKKADEAFWKSVRRNRTYWFKGTNIIAASICPENMLIPDAADPNKDPHGVGTSAAVLTANPEAVMFFIEMCADVGADAAHDIAFVHPAVDVITTSYGAGVPSTGVPLPEASTFRNTFDGVVRLGKLHFSSGGNGPGFTNKRAGAGPWWSIGVSGSGEGSSNGREMRSGYFSDFISDFIQQLPYCIDCERGINDTVPGTSFSTPRAAGIASRVILEVRRALGHTGGIRIVNGRPIMAEGNGRTVTNWDIRRALEEAAYVPTSAEYDPAGAVGDAGGPFIGIPINDEAPWLQIGWGDLTADPAKEVHVNAMAALGFGTATRTKDAGFCDFQTKVMEERILYFSTVVPSADDHPFAGEYVFCGSALPPLPGSATPGNPAPGLPGTPSTCTDQASLGSGECSAA